MAVTYDQYYKTENLFGNPYPELIELFESFPNKGRLLDLGCGQGRDAIALARIGFRVMGIDHSEVGIKQMNAIAKAEKLPLTGYVDDIYAYENFADFEYVLLDSMFHFEKNDRSREVGLIKKIISTVKAGCIITVCIQDSPKKLEILNHGLHAERKLKILADRKFTYTFSDKESGHTSVTNYRMIAVEK